VTDRRPNDNETVRLIREKTGYGLARPAWMRTLETIRKLPELPR
jgi:hypothetical protein